MSFGTLLGKSKLGSIDEENALLEPIKKDINDIDAILRYSDYLQRNGDPYGEFIALYLSYQDNKQSGKVLTKLKQLFPKISRFNPSNSYDKSVMKTIANESLKDDLLRVPLSYNIKNGFITGVNHFDIGEWLEYGHLLLQDNPLLVDIDFTISADIDSDEESPIKVYNIKPKADKAVAQFSKEFTKLYNRVKTYKNNVMFPANCTFISDDGQLGYFDEFFLEALFNNILSESIKHLDISSFDLSSFPYTRQHPLRSDLVQKYITGLTLERSNASDIDFNFLVGLGPSKKPENRTSSKNLEYLNLVLTSITYRPFEILYENKEIIPNLKELHVASDNLFDYSAEIESYLSDEENTANIEIFNRWHANRPNLEDIIKKVKEVRPNLKVIVHDS